MPHFVELSRVRGYPLKVLGDLPQHEPGQSLHHVGERQVLVLFLDQAEMVGCGASASKLYAGSDGGTCLEGARLMTSACWSPGRWSPRLSAACRIRSLARRASSARLDKSWRHGGGPGFV